MIGLRGTLIKLHIVQVEQTENGLLLQLMTTSEHLLLYLASRWQENFKKAQFFKKVAKSPSQKKENYIYYKAPFESPKDPHQTTFEALKYFQQTMFWNCLFR